jgi:hypothetical protein
MAEPFVAPRPPWAWERWLPLAGVAAVVLWVTAILLDPGTPGLFEAPGEEWLTFVTGNEGGILASRMLLLLGDFLLIVFLGTLRTSLRTFEGEPGHWTAIAFGSGIATAVMLMAASTPVLAAAAAADALEPSAAQALGVVEYAFFIGAGITAAVLLTSTGLLAVRTGGLPAWLGWASLVVALLLLINIGPIAFIAIVIGFPLWVLVTSVLLWRRRERAASA